MSKSIRELMVEAGMQFRLDSISAKIENKIASFEELYVYDKFDPVKYAELIVKKCVEVLRMVPYDSDGPEFGDEVVYQEAVKKHFGVEE